MVARGDRCRPVQRPQARVIKTIGYFNCDYIKCDSWQDCYPEVQLALITVEDDVITAVEHYKGEAPKEEFAILEPVDLRQT